MENLGIYLAVFINMLRIEESRGNENGTMMIMGPAMQYKIQSEAERVKSLLGQRFDEVELDEVLQNAINIAMSDD